MYENGFVQLTKTFVAQNDEKFRRMHASFHYIYADFIFSVVKFERFKANPSYSYGDTHKTKSQIHIDCSFLPYPDVKSSHEGASWQPYDRPYEALVRIFRLVTHTYLRGAMSVKGFEVIFNSRRPRSIALLLECISLCF